MIISKTELIDNIKREINDNSNGQITPSDIRHNLLDIIDSVHNLTHFSNLKSKNFDTEQGSRTTRIGSVTLDNFRRGINGYSSVDNTTIGYASLSKNYQGYANTAIGSYALNCNIHGHNNVAVGFNSAAANTTGYGNVTLGNYALHNNKVGNLNIAIGHGAGYYVNRDTSNKLFIASHNVDTDYICSNEDGVGLTPLIFGDLDNSNLRLGVGVTSLHEGATLQVGGSIHGNQESNYSYDLGSNVYRFRDLYLSNTIYFAESNYIRYDSVSNKFLVTSATDISGDVSVSGGLDVLHDFSTSGNFHTEGNITASGSMELGDSLSLDGNIIPKTHLKYRLGDEGSSWLSVNVHNLNVTGKTVFNKFEAVEQAHYLHKTIFLASSGYINSIDGGGARSLTENYHPNDNIEPPVGYLKDEELSGAGFNINSKDIASDYDRTYKFTFSPPDNTLSYLSQDNQYSRSHWTSNISIETTNGSHIKTEQIINSARIGVLNYITGLGLFVEDSSISFGNQSLISSMPSSGNINFVADVNSDNYTVSLLAPSSKTNINQRFLSNTSSYTEGQLRGYELSYINTDPLNAPEFFNPSDGQSYDRLVLKSYKDQSYCSRSLIMMNEGNDGFVGINNFNRGEYLIPDTILNVRSTGDAVIRMSAENLSASKAGIQMLSTSNCLEYGVDLYYANQDKTLNLDLYNNSVKNRLFLANSVNTTFGIFTDISEPNEMLTIGSSSNSDSVVSMFINPSLPASDSNYGKIFIRSINQDSKTAAPTFLDDSGNFFDFVLRSIDSQGGESIDIFAYADAKRNTLVGNNSPELRSNILTSNDNTSLGFSSFGKISTGDRNTSIGSYAGASVAGTVSDNIYIGYKAGDNSELLDRNIIIGNQITSAAFAPAYTSDLLMIDGVLEVHKNKAVSKNSSSYLINDSYIKNAVLNITHGVSNSSPSKNLSLDPILGNISYSSDSDDVLSVVINDAEVTNTRANPDAPSVGSLNYSQSSNNYLEVLGDLRITGKILWSDGSSVNSGQIQEDVFNLQTDLSSTNTNLEAEKNRIDSINASLSSLFVEGYADGTILPPQNANSPTVGNVTLKQKISGSWTNGTKVQLTNRDTFLRINRGDFVIAIQINGEYRPIFVSYGS